VELAGQHESKDAQKINYDKDRYDVEFAIGSKVLWFAQDPKDKLYMKWYGPYTVTQRLSDVVYEIKDELDGEKRKVTVSQIVPSRVRLIVKMRRPMLRKVC